MFELFPGLCKEWAKHVHLPFNKPPPHKNKDEVVRKEDCLKPMQAFDPIHQYILCLKAIVNNFFSIPPFQPYMVEHSTNIWPDRISFTNDKQQGMGI